jgi:cytochrome c553
MESIASTLAAAIVAAALGPAAASLQERTGEQIYRTLCVSCHGPEGEGTPDYPDPLTGRRSLENLVRYIDKNMPEGAPEKCVGEDARKVAEYIYGAFYSREAQARRRQPKIELARLTVGQYRNALADLLALPTSSGPWDERRGLRAEYFNSGRRLRDDRRVLDRVDRTVRFSFGSSSPADRVSGEEYAIRWSGGLFAPDTGEYEFVVETDNGVRLWVNASDPPLIDAWVRSGTDLRHKETIFLLGGRVYPIRLEFFKSKQDKTASVTLKWKRPHRVEEVIPERHLSPARFAEVFVVRAPFPPDDRSMGYERSTSISKAWEEATTEGALEAASYVLSRLPALSGVSSESPEARGRLREWARRFVERAFRRPLSDEDRQAFVDRFFEGNADPEAAVKRVVLLALKSPRFLYQDLDPAQSDAYDVASRIAFGLWDSLPDAPLLDAARKGALSSPEEVQRQIDRMLPDPRTRAKVRAFFHQWMKLDRLHDLGKDPKRYPDFTPEIISDLRTSLDLFVEEIVWGETPDFRQLLLADYAYMNGRLAAFYGASLPAESPFQKVTLPKERYAGIVTHPLLMAGFAYQDTSSPIHRGLFVAKSLLGKRLRPPQEAVTPLSAELHPNLTTRERVALQTRPENCQSCHRVINPLGFALEHYDAVGRFRTEENGRPIDASGGYADGDGGAVTFRGGRELAEFLAKCEETHAAFVEHLFHFFIRQPIRAHGVDRLETLRKEFAASGFDLRKLVGRVVATSALHGNRTTAKGKTP